MVEDIIDIDFQYAQITMRNIWAVCKKLEKRRVSVFEAVNMVTEAIGEYELNMLLNKGG